MANDKNAHLESILKALSESDQSTRHIDSAHQPEASPQGENDLSPLISLLTKNQPGSLQRAGSDFNISSTNQVDRRDDSDWSRPLSYQPAPSSKTRAKLPDTSDITDWRSGLRHITKLASTDELFEPAIRKMIKNQNENEERWWTGRLNLIQQQKERVDNERQLNSILSSVNGKVMTEPETHDYESELKRYDEKVHRAMVHMTKSMTKELATLNVPFFNIKAELILDKAAGEDATKFGEGRAQTPITHAQLDDLQHRILEYLRDMYGD